MPPGSAPIHQRQHFGDLRGPCAPRPAGSARRTLPLPGHRVGALVSDPRPRHAVRVCPGECQASPGTREVARWRVIGRNETRSSGCLAGPIHLPGRVRNRGVSLASRLTGTVPSTGIDSVHSDIPSRRTSSGCCGAAWVLSHQKKVTQSRRTDPVPEGISAGRARWDICGITESRVFTAASCRTSGPVTRIPVITGKPSASRGLPST
jgi:hypothetical protein